MRAVLDTNVVVSGLLKPYSSSASILRLIINKKIEIALDARITSEYHQVLHRPKFPFTQHQIDDFLEGVKNAGVITSPVPLKKQLPDPGDAPFLEVAIASNADHLITGNTMHYPPELCEGIRVITPTEFIEAYREE